VSRARSPSPEAVAAAMLENARVRAERQAGERPSERAMAASADAHARAQRLMQRLQAYVNEHGGLPMAEGSRSPASTSKTLKAIIKLLKKDEMAARLVFFCCREREEPEDLLSALLTASEAVLEACD
jgi:hypothetical protein